MITEPFKPSWFTTEKYLDFKCFPGSHPHFQCERSVSCDLVSFLARISSNQRVKNDQWKGGDGPTPKNYHSYLLKRKVWFLLHLMLPYSPLAHPSLSQCALFMEVWSQVLQGLLWPESCRTIGRFSNPPYTCDRELGIWHLFEVSHWGWCHWGAWLTPSRLVCVPGGLLSGSSLGGILRGWFDQGEPPWQSGPGV